VRVWTPGEGSGKRGLRVDEPGALPVHNGDFVRLEARLNRDAFVYLLWLDSEGRVQPLYPWNEDEIKFDLTALPPRPPPRATVLSPGGTRLKAPGWEVEGKSG